MGFLVLDKLIVLYSFKYVVILDTNSNWKLRAKNWNMNKICFFLFLFSSYSLIERQRCKFKNYKMVLLYVQGIVGMQKSEWPFFLDWTTCV